MRRSCSQLQRFFCGLCLAGVFAGLPLARAQQALAATPGPATQPAYPALEQLNLECQSLFQQMQGNVLRVQMPQPRWAADPARFQKYNLNSEVNRVIQQRAARGGNYDPAASRPATPPQEQQLPDRQGKPADKEDATATTNSAAPGYTIIIPAQQADPQQLVVNNAAQNNNAGFVANNVGLLLNDRGHLLVPTYLEREAAGDETIKLAYGDGEMLHAKYVGSDQQTQLTVLQLAPPHHAADKIANAGPAPDAGEKGQPPGQAAPRLRLGEPVKLSDEALPEGTLVLLLSPADGSGRLTVWNGGAKESGVVVTIDGRIAGIARHGQFLSASACRLIADQIIRHGAVRRATLGVIITQVEPTDPARQVAALGDKPAVRIDQVMKDSVAEAGGLRQGDLILSLAGEPVHDIPSLAAAIAARQGPTELRVLRDGQVMSVRVDLVQK